jgi:hypothetical protein
MTTPVQALRGGIRLECIRVSDQAGDHFVRLWDRAWDKLLPSAQDRIERYWASRQAPLGCRHKANAKPLYDSHVFLYFPGPGLLTVQSDGHLLCMCWPTLEDMGDEIATVAILHELAHVNYYASSEPNHWPDHQTAETRAACEHLVNQLLREWGVDQTTVLRWKDEWSERHPSPANALS